MDIKHRIYVTLPDSVLASMRSFMRNNGIASEASACQALIVRALYAYDLHTVNTDPPACGKALAARAGAEPA